MQQIINFLIRNKTFLLFVLLFSISLFFTIQSHSYHRSKFINSANFLTGGVYASLNNIDGYFNLRTENEILLEENSLLKAVLYNSEVNAVSKETLDSTRVASHYKLTPAEVYKNSYSATNNYLIINKGQQDSIGEDFGVISSKGIVGIIDNTSNGYSRVISVLNTNIRVNAKLKKTNHFGTLTWNGNSPKIVQLIDVPNQAPVAIGDSIVTGGLSTIFPKNIPVGTVVDFKLDETENYFTLDIELYNDMTNIGHVYIIENKDFSEISTLSTADE